MVTIILAVNKQDNLQSARNIRGGDTQPESDEQLMQLPLLKFGLRPKLEVRVTVNLNKIRPRGFGVLTSITMPTASRSSESTTTKVYCFYCSKLLATLS